MLAGVLPAQITTVAGQVYGDQRVGIPGITVFIYSPGTAGPVGSAVTDDNGRFEAKGFTQAILVASPYNEGWFFEPIYHQVYRDTVKGSCFLLFNSHRAQGRSPYFNVYVRVSTAAGEPIKDINVSFRGPEITADRVTGSDGMAGSVLTSDPNFYLWGSVTVRPSARGWTFSPASVAVSGSTYLSFVAQRTQSLEDDLIGRWRWFNGGENTIAANNTMIGRERGQVVNEGTWQIVDRAQRQVVLRWRSGDWIDTVTVSADGLRLNGTNNVGRRIWAEKIVR
jgi:hypothetical protein